ncbi:hypothetical protein TH62_12850 [Bacillus sp. TH008]|nr:hypothetical protein TH62_12850 [Bacillus sp. TH008]
MSRLFFKKGELILAVKSCAPFDVPGKCGRSEKPWNRAMERMNRVKSVISVKGKEFICMDSNVKHDFASSHSLSILIQRKEPVRD